MGVENVSNIDVKTTGGLTVNGQNGKKLTKPEEKLAQVIANLDGKGELSKSDIEKLKKMKPEEQIKFLNNALKDTGYKVAKVYDGEADETTEGVTWRSNGLFINFSKDGKTIETDIMGDAPGDNGFLGIRW